MLIRTSVLPKTIQDAIVTLFVMFIIPAVYWFELFVVLPSFYELWSVVYTFHFLCGTFILFNVTSNLVATIICDTSIKGRFFPSALGPGWHFCAVCESSVPPRSWHCNICNICILKRDHHCMFTSCCIGHCNQRYFMVFVFYIFIATVYATYFNNYFIWSFMEFRSWVAFVNVIFPLAMFILHPTPHQGYLFLYIIVIITCIFTGVLLYDHMNLIFRGCVTHERNKSPSEYDSGKIMNLVSVFGERWYTVFLCPFISSKLPHDGINWRVTDSFKNR